MNLGALTSALDLLALGEAQEGAWQVSWLHLFGLARRGLLVGLARGLQSEPSSLPAFALNLPGWFRQRSAFVHLAEPIQLYAGAAAVMAGYGTPDALVARFGAAPVADVKAEMEGALKSELPYREVWLNNLIRSGPPAVWPWETRIASHVITVPVVAVRAGHEEGHSKGEGWAAWFRFEWVERVETVGVCHVYLAPAQMHVRRTGAQRPPTYRSKETPWWEPELAILDYLAARLTSVPVEPAFDKWPTPYALPLSLAEEGRLGGDIRWWLTMEGGREEIAWTGDSYGLAYLLGLVQLLGRVGAALPTKWEKLAKENLMSGVLGMATVDRDGKLGPIGLTDDKLRESSPSYIRREGRTIHTVLAAREEEKELRRTFELDTAGWVGPGKELRFLFVSTVDEAIEVVLQHLGTLGQVERAIRLYGNAREAEWRQTFGDPQEERPWSLPPYLERQGLHILADSSNLMESLEHGARLMPPEGNSQETSQDIFKWGWQPMAREDLLERFCAVPKEAGAGEDSLRLVCVTHHLGQGKSAFLLWLERRLRERLPSGYWVVLMRLENLCRPLEDVLSGLAYSLGLVASSEVLTDLRTRLEEGRIVLLGDGLDGVSEAMLTEKLANLIQAVGPLCRCVVAGRPLALERHWAGLFRSPTWRFLLLDYLTVEDQRRYLGNQLFDFVTEWGECPQSALAVPLVLRSVWRWLSGPAQRVVRIQHENGKHTNEIKPGTESSGGALTFSVGDLVDLQSILGRLKRQTRAFDTWLAGQLSLATRAALASHPGPSSGPATLREALLQDFNALIGGANIYEERRFADIALRSETRTLLSRNPQGSDAQRLNRLLIEDAYPFELWRTPQGWTRLGEMVRAATADLLESHGLDFLMCWGNYLRSEAEVEIARGAGVACGPVDPDSQPQDMALVREELEKLCTKEPRVKRLLTEVRLILAKSLLAGTCERFLNLRVLASDEEHLLRPAGSIDDFLRLRM